MGMPTIRTTTDKEIVLKVIKDRVERFVYSMDSLDTDTKKAVDAVLSMETLPKTFFWVMKEHDDEYINARTICLKIENGRVTFRAEGDEDSISTAIETYCLCEFMEEE